MKEHSLNVIHEEVAEWLKRQTVNLFIYVINVGSNPTLFSLYCY